MHQTEIEKRKFPRLDTSGSSDWIIRIYGTRKRPVEGDILNLSLGGVAFVGPWEKVARTIKGYATKVEIVMPNGKIVEVNSTLHRVRPKKQSDCYVCVMLFSDLSGDSIRYLKNYMPN